MKVSNIQNFQGRKISVPRTGSSKTVGKVINGRYGRLRIFSSGRFAYTMFRSRSAIWSLTNQQKLVEKFKYTARNNAPRAVQGHLRVRIRGVDDPDTIKVIAGGGADTTPADGETATDLSLQFPQAVAIDKFGRVYVADDGRNALIRINTDGKITVIAGGGADTTPTDGENATDLQLGTVEGVAVDSSGRVYYTESSADRVIRVNTDGTITIIAGGGADTTPADGENATDLDLSDPFNVAVDSSGQVYFTDSILDHVIRVNTNGTITVIAGGGADTTPADGENATDLDLSDPFGVAVDSSGQVYFADITLDQVIRVNTDGTITVIAGGGVDTTPADGENATDLDLSDPAGVAVDSSGQVYFTDITSDRVIRVNTDGTIKIIAGGGADNSPADGENATDLDLSNPFGIAVDKGDRVYFTDNAYDLVFRLPASA